MFIANAKKKTGNDKVFPKQPFNFFAINAYILYSTCILRRQTLARGTEFCRQ